MGRGRWEIGIEESGHPASNIIFFFRFFIVVTSSFTILCTSADDC